MSDLEDLVVGAHAVASLAVRGDRGGLESIRLRHGGERATPEGAGTGLTARVLLHANPEHFKLLSALIGLRDNHNPARQPAQPHREISSRKAGDSSSPASTVEPVSRRG